MDIKNYQLEAKRTCPKLENNKMDLIHMALGMQTEAAEISDVFKKKLAYDKEVDWVNVKEEIGDLMWYIANLCSMNQWNLEDILETNIRKLRARYPDKFTNELAINRDLTSERKELER